MDTNELHGASEPEAASFVLELGQASVETRGCLGPFLDLIFNFGFAELDRD